ncbi:MAG: hypothetical protein ACXVZL_06955, partial [Gaiellaceae bacterium]
MTRLLRRTVVRNVGWAIFLVLVAVAAGYAHLDAWVILAVMAAAWLFVAFVELLVSRHSAEQRAAAAAAVPAPQPTTAPAPAIEH